MRRFLAFFAVFAGLYLAWYHETRFPVRLADAPPQPLVVLQGASAETIGEKLRDLGLVRHPAVFRLLVYSRGDGARLRAGEYSLEGPLTLAEIEEILVKGEVVRHDVTFPEGKSLGEMVALAAAHGLDAAAFLKAARDPGPIRDLDADATDLRGISFQTPTTSPTRPMRRRSS